MNYDDRAPVTASNNFVVVMNIIRDSGEKQNACFSHSHKDMIVIITILIPWPKGSLYRCIFLKLCLQT